MSVAKIDTILSIISFSLNVCVLTPLEIWWLKEFWDRRRNLFISKRNPSLLMAVQVGYFCWVFMWWTQWTFNSFNLKFPDTGSQWWKDGNLYSWFTIYLVIVEFNGVGLCRWWLLYFMIKTSSALKGNKWKSIINPRHEEEDWYLNHRDTYGSWHWIKPKLFLYAITAAIAGSLSYHFLDENNSLAIEYKIVYWVCNAWYLVYNYVLSLILIFFILKRIPILDDAIGLKKELKVIAYFLLIQVILGICFRVIDPNIIAFDDDLRKYQPIFNQIVVLLMRFSRFFINFMQTRWVVDKFGVIQRHSRMNSYWDSNAITLSSTKVRKIVNETTLRLMENPDRKMDGDEHEKRMEMKNALMRNTVFEAFMRQLLKEYCHECLLSIIEMIQFKERIHKEELSQIEVLLPSQTLSWWILTKDFLSIPKEFPKSAIVYGGNDYKAMVSDLYCKYIAEGAPYEITLEFPTKKRLQDLIDCAEWETNEEYRDPQKL